MAARAIRLKFEFLTTDPKKAGAKAAAQYVAGMEPSIARLEKRLAALGAAGAGRGMGAMAKSIGRDADAAGARVAALQRQLSALGGAGTSKFKLPASLTTLPASMMAAFTRSRAATAANDMRRLGVALPGMQSGFGGAAGGIESMLGNVGRVGAKALSPVASGLGTITTGANAAAKAIGKLPAAMLGLGAGIYAIRSIGGALDKFVVQPTADAARFLNDSVETSRRFRYSVASVTPGGLGGSGRLDEQLIGASRRGPATVSDLSEAGTALAFLPGLSGQISWSRDVESAAKGVQDFAKLSRQLQAVDPSQPAGATISLRNLAEGGNSGFISLKRRYGISSASLGRAVSRELGVSVREAIDAIEADPQLATRALGKFLDQMLPESASDRFSRLLSNRLEHLRDAVAASAVKLGEGGIYDAIGARVKKISDGVFDLWSSPDFTRGAAVMGESLGRTLDNAGEAITRFIGRLAGTDNVTSGVRGFFGVLVAGSEALAGFSDKWPQWGTAFADFLRDIGRYASEAIDGIRELAASVKQLQSGGIGSFLFGGGKPTASSLVPASIQRAVGMPGPAAVSAVQQLPGASLFVGGPATRPTAAGPVAPLVERLIRDEYEGVGWGGRSANVSQLLGRLGAEPEKDELSFYLRTSGRIFDADLANDKTRPVNLGNLFARMREDQQAALSQFDAAIGQGSAALANRPDDALAGKLDTLKTRRAASVERYGVAVDNMRDLLVEGARDFASGLASNLGDLPPETAAFLQERVAAGTTTLGGRIGKIPADAKLEVPGGPRKAWGVESLPLGRQISLADADRKRRTDALTDAMRLGAITDGAGRMRTDVTSDQVVDLKPLFERDAQARLQTYLEASALPEAKGLFGQARSAFLASPGDEKSLANLGQAQRQLAELAAKLREVRQATDYASEGWRQFAESGREALDRGLASSIQSIIRGTGRMRDVLTGFADDITAAFSRMSSENVLQLLIGNAGRRDQQGNQAGLGGLLGQLLGTAASGASGGSGATAASAVPGFAAGGVVSARPGGMLARLGEGGRNEAIIPLTPSGAIPLSLRNGALVARLPGGGHRSVPTSFNGSGAVPRGDRSPVHTHTIVVNSDAEAREAAANIYATNPDAIIDVITADLMRGGRTRKALNRKP